MTTMDELHTRAWAEYTELDPFGVSERSWRGDFTTGVAAWDDQTLLANTRHVVDRIEQGLPSYAAGYTRAVLLGELHERALDEYNRIGTR